MSIWVMSFIGGVLCTQIANPFFWYRIAKSVINYKHAMQKFRTGQGETYRPKYREYLEKEEIGVIKTAIVGNIICFLVCSAILWLKYYFCADDRTISRIFESAWFFAIGNWFSSWSTFGEARRFSNKEFLQVWAYAIAILVICIALFVHSVIYNFNNHINANTFLTETEVPAIGVDVINTLEKEVVIQGYTIQNPVNRNGKVIFPLSRGGNVSIAGYVELTTDGTPHIVLKDLHYTPYQKGNQNIKYVARDFLPTKQFFGDWSFQLSPDGEVYFVKMYGRFASLRAGRVVEGMLLINATTGTCLNYPLSGVPDWINGISE